jgi:hypothetical protein
VGADCTFELKLACTTHEHFACHLDHLHFPAFFMTRQKFAFPMKTWLLCSVFSFDKNRT